MLGLLLIIIYKCGKDFFGNRDNENEGERDEIDIILEREFIKQWTRTCQEPSIKMCPIGYKKEVVVTQLDV
tara:strand:- start:810 stop:1022 length:213 start_codon:yes stop_codon:yes gene_type:complete